MFYGVWQTCHNVYSDQSFSEVESLWVTNLYPVLFGINIKLCVHCYLIVHGVTCCVSVSSRVNDAENSQTNELHCCISKCSPESQNEGTRVHSSDHGARVQLLHRPSCSARLPVSLPIYHDSIQLLLLYLCGKDTPPSQSQVSLLWMYGQDILPSQSQVSLLSLCGQDIPPSPSHVRLLCLYEQDILPKPRKFSLSVWAGYTAKTKKVFSVYVGRIYCQSQVSLLYLCGKDLPTYMSHELFRVGGQLHKI